MPGTYVAHNEPVDPLDVAMQPPEPAKFWGQVKDIETYRLGFKKGADGKYERPTPYDPEYHDFPADQIKFTLLPLDPTRPIKEMEMGIDNRRNPEFRQIVQKSILALGEKICQLRQAPIEGANFFRLLIGLYIHGEYVKRPWNKDGEDWTTLEFRDVFATEAECQAHQNAMREENGDGALPFPEEQSLPRPVRPENRQAPATPPQPDPVRASLIPFLQVTWTQANQNATQFLAAIAANPMLAQYFNAESPEVKAIVATAGIEVPF
jgi:hypothetical protein